MSPEAGAHTRRLRVDHDGADRFRIGVRGHTMSVDQTVADGGDDSGPTPTELFVAGLASCVAFYVRRFLARHELPALGLAVTADFDMTAHPARVGEVRLQIHLPTELSPPRQAALLAVAAHCTVHNTLLQPPAVAIALAAPAVPSPA
jgi:uncharacterized OsmC-like protein